MFNIFGSVNGLRILGAQHFAEIIEPKISHLSVEIESRKLLATIFERRAE